MNLEIHLKFKSVFLIYYFKSFKSTVVKLLYCLAAIIVNTLLALWVVKTFLWL